MFDHDTILTHPRTRVKIQGLRTFKTETGAEIAGKWLLNLDGVSGRRIWTAYLDGRNTAMNLGYGPVDGEP